MAFLSSPTLPPAFSHSAFGMCFHSAGSLSFLAAPAQLWLAVAQSFLPALATP
jgi:hypothetical protein